jgi:hypothetical protein
VTCPRPSTCAYAHECAGSRKQHPRAAKPEWWLIDDRRFAGMAPRQRPPRLGMWHPLTSFGEQMGLISPRAGSQGHPRGRCSSGRQEKAPHRVSQDGQVRVAPAVAEEAVLDRRPSRPVIVPRPSCANLRTPQPAKPGLPAFESQNPNQANPLCGRDLPELALTSVVRVVPSRQGEGRWFEPSIAHPAALQCFYRPSGPYRDARSSSAASAAEMRRQNRCRDLAS